MKRSIKVAILGAGVLLLTLALASVVYAGTASDDVTASATVSSFISISSPADVALGTITGTGSSSEVSRTWTVRTNNSTGYKLEAKASQANALSGAGDSFGDYSGAGAWTVAAADSAFGFSVANNTSYQGFNGTTPIQVATNSAKAIESTTMYFKAEVGADHMQNAGNYTATVTLVATTNP